MLQPTLSSAIHTAIVLAILGITPIRCFAGHIVEARGRPSQFDLLETSRVETVGPSVPTVFVEESFHAAAQRGYLALAGPGHVFSATVATDSGVPYPSAEASLHGKISFTDNAALRALMTPGKSTIDLSMKLQIAYALMVPNFPGLFRQAVGQVHLLVQQRSQSFTQKTGTISIQNGPFDYTINQSGLLAKGNAFYDVLDITLPISISPTRLNGLNVDYILHASSNSLSLDAFIYSAIGVAGPSNRRRVSHLYGLPDGSNLTTSSRNDYLFLADGRSAAEAGLEFTVAPIEATGTPEPATLLMAVLAIGAVGARKLYAYFVRC